MKQAFVLAAFLLATFVCTVAQQPDTSGGASPSSQSSQTPGASPSQQQPPSSGSQNPAQQNPAQQDPAQPPARDAGPAANQPITEGCLGGSNPNYTLTDKSGTTYKLNFPSQTNVSTLEPHVGESVQVMGDVKSTTIQVSRIGKGNGTCPANKPK